MAYLTIKQVKEQYSVADKTIRRLYEPDKKGMPSKISRSQGYTNRKGRWVFNSDYIQAQFADKIKDQPAQQVNPEPATSQQTSSGELKALQQALELAVAQLKEKDLQLERYDNKLDQQQKLTAQLQNRLLLSEPATEPEPITATKAKPSNKAQPIRKKPVKQPKKPSSDTKKASKPKRWWRR